MLELKKKIARKDTIKTTTKAKDLAALTPAVDTLCVTMIHSLISIYVNIYVCSIWDKTFDIREHILTCQFAMHVEMSASKQIVYISDCSDIYLPNTSPSIYISTELYLIYGRNGLSYLEKTIA